MTEITPKRISTRRTRVVLQTAAQSPSFSMRIMSSCINYRIGRKSALVLTVLESHQVTSPWITSR